MGRSPRVRLGVPGQQRRAASVDGMEGLQSLPVAGFAAFAFAFAESGLGLGVVVPGETAVLAIAASVDGPTATLLVFCAVTLGATAGDHLGYWLGRTQGPRLRGSRAVSRLGAEHWDRATRLLRRHGAAAVLATRLLPVVRTLTPAAAGCSGLRYPRFAVASLCGSMLWSLLYVGGGRMAMTAAETTLGALGTGGWWVVGAAAGVTAAVIAVTLRRRRATARSRARRMLPTGTAPPARPRPDGSAPARPRHTLASSGRSPG